LKRALIIASLVLFVLGAGAALTAWSMFRGFATTPANAQQEEPQVFVVASGQGPGQIARALAAAGLIADARWFKLLVRWQGVGPKLKAGEYELAPAMTPEEILDRLQKGGVVTYTVTIPEGYRINEIAEVFATAGLADAREFRERALRKAAAETFGLADAPHLEGYLFPDTYRFAKGLPVDALLGAMVDRFRQAWTPEWAARAAELGWTQHQIVTLAAIVEKETGAALERPLIAAVFHNRLKADWKLQTDPTVIYGIVDFDGNLTRRHLETDHPYNTYTRKGLPPGPIASPGAKALEAALYPVETEYMFFVACGNDGTHEFNVTLAEHNADVERCQLRGRK